MHCLFVSIGGEIHVEDVDCQWPLPRIWRSEIEVENLMSIENCDYFEAMAKHKIYYKKEIMNGKDRCRWVEYHEEGCKCGICNVEGYELTESECWERSVWYNHFYKRVI